ncbi:MAG: tetratricopeptide repeat-containing sulfotransferase family protein [Phycisphaerales bacterium]
MPASPADLAAVESHLAAGRLHDARLLAERVAAKAPRDPVAWLAVAKVAMAIDRLDEADRAIESAAAIAPQDDRVLFLGGQIDASFGRVDRAVARLGTVAHGAGPLARESSMALCDTLFIAGRLDALQAETSRPVPWQDDPRHAFHAARAAAQRDPESALATILDLAERDAPPAIRRVIGFDAVTRLDRAGRHREAFDLATRLHASTGSLFDLDAILAPLRGQRDMLAKVGRWFTPQASRVDEVAILVALPRSGTTLLEQMLDGHPAIGAIGEHRGVRDAFESLASLGKVGRALAMLTAAEANVVQKAYLDGVRRHRRPGATWALDKTLFAWRVLPVIAAVLPGAKCLSLLRDPRDLAISVFLSYFDPHRDGWTASLDSIRRVIEAHDALLPAALATLGLEHEVVVYEDLVDNPSREASRCLRLLGLELDDAVLKPESNPRTAYTLSHAQVRAPIHRGSIGRWRHYDWAFGPEWDPLVARHEARRITR